MLSSDGDFITVVVTWFMEFSILATSPNAQRFVHDCNGSYPVFTHISGCLRHVPAPDACSRYNRKRW